MVLDGPCSNTMNPTKDATYTFLAMFLQEVGTIFKDEYLFLGGDEVTRPRARRSAPPRSLSLHALPCPVRLWRPAEASETLPSLACRFGLRSLRTAMACL